jgi:hypothetical protein
MLIKTEKRFWKNGHRKYGRRFHTFAFSVKNIGVMISWPWWKEERELFEIQLYKLV